MIDKAHPLYATLKPLDWWLSYTDWREVSEGKYAPLANRLQAQADRLRYVAGFGHGSLVVIVAYRLVHYFFSGGTTDDLVWAAVFGAALVWSFRSDWRRQRRLLRAVSSLREASAVRQSAGASCS